MTSKEDMCVKIVEYFLRNFRSLSRLRI